MNYTTTADLRAFDVTEADASDVQCAAACEVASRLVEDYVGHDFDVPQVRTITIDEVLGGRVVIPGPFQDVTAVTVNNVGMTYWDLTSFGLTLTRPGIKDVDGFPVSSDLGYNPRRPARVTVTATFGYDAVPALVTRAATLLAARFATHRFADMLPDNRIGSDTVEGQSIVVYHGGDDRLDTTGDVEVDRLLTRYRYTGALVR